MSDPALCPPVLGYDRVRLGRCFPSLLLASANGISDPFHSLEELAQCRSMDVRWEWLEGKEQGFGILNVDGDGDLVHRSIVTHLLISRDKGARCSLFLDVHELPTDNTDL